MRSWTLCIATGILAGVANARCTKPVCGSPECLGAVSADPAVGESFCSSWLSLAPATTTVTDIETVTSTLVSLETALTTLTLTTATITQTGGIASTLYLKRTPTLSTADPASTSSPDSAEAIVSECSSNKARISSACSCFLSTAIASTVTVTETAVSTAVVDAASTVVATVTTNVVAIVSEAPAVTIPANPIVNNGFEDYLTTGNILPWSNTSATTGGKVEAINGVNPCTASGSCTGGRVVVRAYPPTAGGGYTGISETFDARLSTTYSVSFLYRCLNFDAQSQIQVWYAGVLVGSALCTSTGAAFSQATGIQFTTGTTGRGELQIRFTNPSNQPYLYYYADDFQAIRV